MGRFGCMMGRFGQCNGPFWTIIFEIKIFGAVLVGAVLAMGRFGIDPQGQYGNTVECRRHMSAHPNRAAWQWQ